MIELTPNPNDNQKPHSSGMRQKAPMPGIAKQKARSLPITIFIWSTETLSQEQVNYLEGLNLQLCGSLSEGRKQAA